LVKALYDLHQAPRAWYDTLENYLLCNGFERGKIDQTLFIKRHKGHILLVQIYVDDIIFGSTKKELCDEFEKLMKDKFQMSSMGELTFFLGLQIYDRLFDVPYSIQARLSLDQQRRNYVMSPTEKERNFYQSRQRAMSEAKSTKKIDWNDPSVIRYHALKMKPKTIAQARRNMIKYLKNQGNYKISDFKGMTYNEIRPIFEKFWDFNQHIEPMEHETKKMKSPEKSPEKMKSPEKIVEEDVDTQEEMKEVVKEPRAKKKKSIPRKSTRKRQK
ncbi:putative ribonuclease H-like domain-containing protein, partial [Tanacetum coccineum]